MEESLNILFSLPGVCSRLKPSMKEMLEVFNVQLSGSCC